jgi:drug/metabolite transporter (DMT)-like permease
VTDTKGTFRAPVLQVALALGAVYLIWGSTYLAIRFAIETIPPFLMAAARYLTAGALLYGWARLRGAPRPSRVHWRSAVVIGAFLLLGGNGGVVWAEQRVDSGLAALLVSTEPLWLVLLFWLGSGRKRLDPRIVAGLLLGFLGVALLVRPGAGSSVDPLGAAVVVLAALSWAWGSLYGQRVPFPASPLVTTGMQMLGGGVLLLAASILTGEPAGFDLEAVSLRSLLALAYLTVFGAIVAFTAYVWLMRSAPPVLVSTYAYVNPVVAVILGWALADEPLTAGTLGAAAVILAGVALITTAQGKPAKPSLPQPPLSRSLPSPLTGREGASEIEAEVCEAR